jgi:hypothetical protein
MYDQSAGRRLLPVGLATWFYERREERFLESIWHQVEFATLIGLRMESAVVFYTKRRPLQSGGFRAIKKLGDIGSADRDLPITAAWSRILSLSAARI